MTDKLKRCPFCGSEDVFIKHLDNRRYSACCRGCDATASHWVTPDNAIAAWNQRAEGEKKKALRSRIAELEAQLAEAKHDVELLKKQFNDPEPLLYEARAKAGELLLERGKPRWIPVTPETMPEDDIEVVGLHNGRDYWNLRIATYLAETNCWTEESHVLAEGTITHYMRLPELPEEQQ